MSEIHGTCFEIMGVGVLLRGASGSGKSDFALRCIYSGAKLVSDDIVVLEKEEDSIVATSPENIRGLIEVRGVGIVKKEYINKAKISLVVDMEKSDKISRIPKEEVCNICGVMLKHIRLYPFEVSAVEKLKTVISILQGKEAIFDGVLEGKNG